MTDFIANIAQLLVTLNMVVLIVISTRRHKALTARIDNWERIQGDQQQRTEDLWEKKTSNERIMLKLAESPRK